MQTTTALTIEKSGQTTLKTMETSDGNETAKLNRIESIQRIKEVTSGICVGADGAVGADGVGDIWVSDVIETNNKWWRIMKQKIEIIQQEQQEQQRQQRQQQHYQQKRQLKLKSKLMPQHEAHLNVNQEVKPKEIQEEQKQEEQEKEENEVDDADKEGKYGQRQFGELWQHHQQQIQYKLLYMSIIILSLFILSIEGITEELSPDHVREMNCGKLYYRTFHLDEETDSLYVGAMDRIYRLNLKNISTSACDRDVINLEPTRDDVVSCVSKGKSQVFDCKNHIRVIQKMQGNRLYVCGTNAHNPKDYVIYSNLTHLPRSEFVMGIGQGIAKCPYDPLDNSTAIYVEDGNPGGLPGLYSGTNAEFTKADTVIFRTDLYNVTAKRLEYKFKRTLKYDSKWLDKPNFVGSFDIGDYVYFFFRETAVEYINCGKAVYSRIARVCKKDVGGKNLLAHNWATYLKARLNCSISGEFPFYFNEIQSVYQLPNDKHRFYATFTTSTNGLIGSAVCSFHINEVQAAFNGKFKEQSSSNSAWLPVLNSRVPDPRPGTCVNDTSNLPDTVLNFIRSHPLMDKAVNHEHNNPVYYKRDLVFTKLVVDKIKIDILNQEYAVYYVGTNLGRIYKIVQYSRNGIGGESSLTQTQSQSQSQSQSPSQSQSQSQMPSMYWPIQSKSKLLDIFEIAPNEAIQVMEISQTHKSLYVATDYRIKQIDLAMCNRRYDNCFRCVRDPYCGWDKETNTCRPYELDLLQDVANETSDICDTSVLKKKIIVTYGQSVHLGCFVKIPEVLKNEHVTWYHHSKDKGRYEIKYNPMKYIETTERGLVVVSVNEADGGRYDCHLGGSLLCSYNITVDAHRCAPPNKSNDYQKIYSDWCHEFEKYKTAMKSWEKKQAQCSSRQNYSQQHPNEVFRKNIV